MAEQSNISSQEPRKATEEESGDELAVIPDQRGRSAHVIAFGAVALAAMIFGFLIGLLF